MSQNSLVIPNTGTLSGLSLVNDANGAFDTLNTLNSGGSAPSSAEADMLWTDTTNGLIKQRDSGNANWIPQWIRGLAHGGGLRASNMTSSITSNTTLTVAQIGQLVICNPSAAISVTLPNANTVPMGCGYPIANYANTAAVTLLATGGNTLDAGPTVYAGGQLWAVSDGSSVWRFLFRSSSVSQSVASPYYTRLPGGVIMQMDTVTVTTNSGGGAAITFGETFPNAIFMTVAGIGDNNAVGLTVQCIASQATTSGQGVLVCLNGSALVSANARINYVAFGR